MRRCCNLLYSYTRVILRARSDSQCSMGMVVVSWKGRFYHSVGNVGSFESTCTYQVYLLVACLPKSRLAAKSNASNLKDGW